MDDEHKDTLPNGEIPPVSQNPKDSDSKEDVASNEQPPEEKPKLRRKVWAWLVVIVVLAAVILFGLHIKKLNDLRAKETQMVVPPAAITIGQSRVGDINIYVDALGTVTPIYTITVFSQITGKVMTVYYTEGQLVKVGDPLVEIDPRPYEALLAQAEATLEHDQSVLEQARIDLARYQAAWARNAIAKQQLDDQVQAVRQAEASVRADEGNVAYARVQLSYCHIVAPISGKVGLRLVDPGNTVFSGNSSTLVVITQLQPITVVFNVSEDDLTQVQSQLSAGRTLEVDAYDRANDRRIEAGKLTALDNQIDTTTGTVKFRGTFPNDKYLLFPNQFVNARLLVRTLRKVVLIPVAAVQRNGTDAFVYIVQSNNTVTVQQITTLATNEQATAVRGVNPGITLATSGFDRLENGVPIVVRPQSAMPAGQTGATAP